MEACLSSHSEGQELRLTGRLLEARDEFRQCGANLCPNQVQRDCISWHEQIQMQIPSVAFRVMADGVSRADVRVLIDGKLVFDQLSGKSVDLNPGPHEVRVELSPFEPHEQSLVVSEGDKFRIVEVKFSSPKEPLQGPGPAGPKPVEMHRPVPVSAYVFGGVSAAAAISGVAWGLSAWSLRSELEAKCAPDCREQPVNVLKQRALITDISWGVSAASLVTASVLYLLRPEQPVDGEPVGVDVGWLPGGGAYGTVTLEGF